MINFIDKKSVFIDENVIIEDDVTIYENNRIQGKSIIKSGTILLPGNFIDNSEIGKNCKIHSSVIQQSKVGDNVSVGPFAHLRPESQIGDGCKIGNFVEIKKSQIGKNTKISHLTYVGDATVGEDCNIGCGVIFCNFDGKEKHKSIVGNHVFIGSNCNLIAPVFVGDKSYICAGTTVTKNVENDEFIIGRVKQEKLNKKSLY